MALDYDFRNYWKYKLPLNDLWDSCGKDLILLHRNSLEGFAFSGRISTYYISGTKVIW